MQRRNWILGMAVLGLGLLGFVVFGSGCGKLKKVKGTVTLDGNPVQGAVVIFDPLDGKGRPASGLTDEEGVFHLGTNTPSDGAYVGDYRVTLKPPVPFPKITYREGMTFGEFAGQYGAGIAELRKNPPKILPFPAEVKDPTKTPLRQRVPADGLVAIELKSSGAEPTRIKTQRTGVDPYGKPPRRR